MQMDLDAHIEKVYRKLYDTSSITSFRKLIRAALLEAFEAGFKLGQTDTAKVVKSYTEIYEVNTKDD